VLTERSRAARSTLGLAAAIAATALLSAAMVRAQQQPPPPAEGKWEKHWRERVEAFRKENAALPKDRANVVFVGDSITEAFPLAKFFPGKPCLNRGIVADRIGNVGERGVLRRLDESVFDCRPAVVLILIGVNDLAASPKAPDVFVRGFGELVDAIRDRLPKVKIVVQTCMPTGRRYGRHEALNPRILAYNEGLRALARERKLPLIDLHALYKDPDGFLPDDLTGDGLHLKRDAYARWAAAAKPLLP
jgi:lysophospholipase L1-like esterase